jgi:shikimate dehydrogenase
VRLSRRRLAVIGHPIAHSRSPAIHNAAFEALGMAAEWSYEAIDLEPDAFAERTLALPADGFVGANVTVPHKHAALALADEVSDAAVEIGAANTLSFEGGRIAADNTDAPGLIAALPDSPAGRRALVLGAGGAARAAIWALAGAGAAVEVWNRTPERARALAAELGAAALEPGGALPSAEFDLLVNATSVGLERSGGAEDPGSTLEALRLPPGGGFRAGQVVVDLVYGSTETELIAAARAAGAATVDGLDVLVRQGAASFQIWTGVDPPFEVMRRAAR